MHVRPYSFENRAAVLRIAADTAYFGAPVERYLDDRRLFQDVFYRYYTDLEPEHGWVACDEDHQVVGFLMGCTNTRRYNRRMLTHILPSTLARLLIGRYRLGRRTWRYLAALLGAVRRGELSPTPSEQYPAHLHINLVAAARGHGLGRRLMDAYLQQLTAEGVPGVHLHTTGRNQAACHLYQKMGFYLLDARPTRLWQSISVEIVENRCYVRSL